VTIRNETPASLALTYGNPGTWKRLPFGATGGVGIAPYTGYFSGIGAANYVKVRCAARAGTPTYSATHPWPPGARHAPRSALYG
jgi:hypothetical protein